MVRRYRYGSDRKKFSSPDCNYPLSSEFAELGCERTKWAYDIIEKAGLENFGYSGWNIRDVFFVNQETLMLRPVDLKTKRAIFPLFLLFLSSLVLGTLVLLF